MAGHGLGDYRGAAVYAALSPKSWQSSQAIIVRNEAIGSEADAARFHGPDELKSIEETIVELSKGRNVLRGALAEVGRRPIAAGRPPGQAMPTLRTCKRP